MPFFKQETVFFCPEMRIIKKFLIVTFSWSYHLCGLNKFDFIHLPDYLQMLRAKRKSVNTSFHCLWYDSTWEYHRYRKQTKPKWKKNHHNTPETLDVAMTNFNFVGVERHLAGFIFRFKQNSGKHGRDST